MAFYRPFQSWLISFSFSFFCVRSHKGSYKGAVFCHVILTHPQQHPQTKCNGNKRPFLYILRCLKSIVQPFFRFCCRKVNQKQQLIFIRTRVEISESQILSEFRLPWNFRSVIPQVDLRFLCIPSYSVLLRPSPISWH